MLCVDCRKCKNVEEGSCRIYGDDPEEAVKACARDGFKNCKRKNAAWDKSPIAVRYCKLFSCKRYRWMQICCTDCRAENCEERCQNVPEKCRQVERGVRA